jgi:hypothetical protein
MNVIKAVKTLFDAQPHLGDMCICVSDQWQELSDLRIRKSDPEVEVGPFLDINNLEPGRVFAGSERAKVQLSPYSGAFRERHPETAALAWLVRDLASSNLRNEAATEVQKLIDLLKNDRRLAKVDRDFIDACLKCCAASGVFLVKVDRRTRDLIPMLELSPMQREFESKRLFAGTLADELLSYSERIRHLVRHTSSVGTYRENLLQSLLRKHLPERYHVATGFIYGCERQIDVIIYDRIDYAPIFREGDLVVVPPEAVRAIIEVKTNLTLEQLRKSLEQIEQVSTCDDFDPPFFKGIFAFETDVESQRLLQEVVNFYMEDPDDFMAADDSKSGFRGWHQINTPYHHLTCLCVLGTTYGQVNYELNESNETLHPVLRSRSSATGLPTQAAHFLETLLSYLRFGGLKPFDPYLTRQMLGADTQSMRVGELTNDWWGGFFAKEEGLPGGEERERLDRATIMATENWVDGSAWESPKEPRQTLVRSE